MGDNFPHENNHSNGNKNIVCGLCNQAFTNFQSLINHIEAHMATENLALRRLNNPLQLNFSTPMPMQETTNFVKSTIFQEPHQQQHSQHVMSHVGNNNVADVTSFSFSAPQEVHMEVSPIDGTKPYINMLDKPIDNNVLINSDNINDDTLLDLELKL